MGKWTGTAHRIQASGRKRKNRAAIAAGAAVLSAAAIAGTTLGAQAAHAAAGSTAPASRAASAACSPELRYDAYYPGSRTPGWEDSSHWCGYGDHAFLSDPATQRPPVKFTYMRQVNASSGHRLWLHDYYSGGRWHESATCFYASPGKLIHIPAKYQEPADVQLSTNTRDC